MDRYKFVGKTLDGWIVFQDMEYSSDVDVVDFAFALLHSSDKTFDGGKYFVVPEAHARARGLVS